MANRPVFTTKESAPFYEICDVEFVWNSGFAKSQKQKNIRAIHEEFTRRRPDGKVLEISSKSLQEGGTQLSAFALPKYVPSLGRSVPVECVYQAGKVFEKGGPYTDLLTTTPKEAKQDERLKNSGKLLRFEYEGQSFPLVPASAFYDYLYINALLENPELAKTVLAYNAFTDIEFNPNKGIGCQAKTAAVFAALSGMGLLGKVKDPDSFLSLYKLPPRRSVAVKPAEKKTDEVRVPSAVQGSVLRHKTFGEGTVTEVRDRTIKVSFPSVGEKVLGLDWCRKNCEFLNG